MKITVERGAFLKALSHVQSVVERRNTIPILSNLMIEAAKGRLRLTATDLDIEIVEFLAADVLRNGAATAPAHMLYAIGRKLPVGAQVQAQVLTSEGASDMPGVIVPRKAVTEVRRLLDDADDAVEISLSDTKIQFVSGSVELTSKLIDGTFPDYQRVIPSGNDKVLSLDSKEFSHSVDRVSTISADKTRAVKLNLAKDKLTLSVVNPDSGTATEELGASYSAAPIEIGFNARYLLDITGQIEGKDV